MTPKTFLDLLELDDIGDSTWLGGNLMYPWGRIFGGQVVAQALRAAAHTVASSEPESENRLFPHSLHAYFLRPGELDEPVRYHVTILRDGSSFKTRLVEAKQHGRVILHMACSFHGLEESVDIQVANMPKVTTPEDSPEIARWPGIMEIRGAESENPGTAVAWLRVDGKFGDDPILHSCAIAFGSDGVQTPAIRSLHPESDATSPLASQFWAASLDHAIWFHRPQRADEWHLHEFKSMVLTNNRGHATGQVFGVDGVHVATVSQELLLRQLRNGPNPSNKGWSDSDARARQR